MIPIRKFSHLAFDLPEREIFLRLGGNCFKTVLSPEEKKRLDLTSRTAAGLLVPQGRYAVLPLNGITASGVETPAGHLETGRDFLAFHAGAVALFAAAVTIGSRLTAARDGMEKISDGMIYDAVGSECADAAMDTVCKLARRELCRMGCLLPERRFSPGYGDMKLELQKFFFEYLNMAEMEVVLDENYFFTPEKTVTAFAFVHKQ